MTAQVFELKDFRNKAKESDELGSLPEIRNSITNLGINPTSALDYSTRLTKIAERIYTIYSNNLEAVGFDASFSLLFITTIMNIANDELIKIGLCSAVNRSLFEACRQNAIKSLQEVEYIDTFDEEFDLNETEE